MAGTVAVLLIVAARNYPSGTTVSFVFPFVFPCFLEYIATESTVVVSGLLLHRLFLFHTSSLVAIFRATF